MSLDNWAYLQTKQNPEIKQFLSEYGFQQLSDWALLNRVRPHQLEKLSSRDQALIQAFHAVYRRDRRLQEKRNTKCSNPSPAQLQEMLTLLPPEEMSNWDTAILFADLKRIASELRQYDIWCNRESLDLYDPTTQTYTSRADLPHTTLTSGDIEQAELSHFLHDQLQSALIEAINHSIHDRIMTLSKSKRYADYAQAFIPGLLLYYRQGLSLREVANQLGMTSWDQARRILNPGALLRQVRTRTVESFLKQTLDKAQQMGLTQQSPEPEYLSTLIEQTEAFVDTEIFLKAAEELRVGKNRSLNSLYAQQLSLSLKNHPQKIPRALSSLVS